MNTRTYYEVDGASGRESNRDNPRELLIPWHYKAQKYFQFYTPSERPEALLVKPLIAQAHYPRYTSDFSSSSTNVMIVSPRIRDLIERVAPDQCDFATVHIMHKDTLLHSNFAVLRPKRIIDCMDMTRARLVGLVYMSVAVDPTRVPSDCNIFAIHDSPLRLFVDNVVRDALVAIKVTGVTFTHNDDIL